ncbi:hydrogenase maturation protease [Hydrogenispora ethanolica]|uniref:Hydrogenase maturation protease n=1 Tax=Hydrogenispora ethanolica TaxID=1082276 RepID=A0A4R1R8D9_HYDET|nr:hydrogenase maturation protease [Hydrogenispora ethanolica]TCL61906.1 hydrogenase maturation protease [Hydrogenispora ethanolica]
MREICIIGIGNEIRGDDGVGPAVVRELQKGALSQQADFFDLGGKLFEIPDLARSYPSAFIVDALPPAGDPGTITFIPWHKRWKEPVARYSLHDLDLIWQMQMAGDDAEKIWLVGVEIASLEWGVCLSPELNRKLPDIIRTITRQIHSLLEE